VWQVRIEWKFVSDDRYSVNDRTVRRSEMMGGDRDGKMKNLRMAEEENLVVD
jgi:hypothetical protein